MKKFMKISQYFLATTTLLGLTAPVWSYGGPPPMDQAPMDQTQRDRTRMDPLARFDANRDGRVTRQEVTTGLSAEFTTADSNHDGKLSYAEFHTLEQQRRTNQVADAFAFLDQDGNDEVSATEFADGHPQVHAANTATVFTLADLDGNAALSLTELDALMASGDLIWRFVQLDGNTNGSVSEKEFLAKPSALPAPSHHP